MMNEYTYIEFSNPNFCCNLVDEQFYDLLVKEAKHNVGTVRTFNIFLDAENRNRLWDLYKRDKFTKSRIIKTILKSEEIEFDISHYCIDKRRSCIFVCFDKCGVNRVRMKLFRY